MDIPIKELKYDCRQKHYQFGYRVVYFYENFHEIIKNICVKKIENLAKYCKLDNNASLDDILDNFLRNNKKALAVAIYEIKTGNEIARKYQKNIKKEIKDYVIFKEELMYDYDVENFIDGYRLIYFQPNNKYSIGAFCKTIEGFMLEFCDLFPIDDESDIPKFVSVEDILERSLSKWPDIEAVAIYKTNGTCVLKKSRTKIK